MITTIIITTTFGRWDEAYEELEKLGLTLTVNNTITVESEKIEEVLLQLWELTVDNTIDGFTVSQEHIKR